jgi:hypothetical protein
VRVRVVEDAGGLGSVGRLSRADLKAALAPIGEVAAMVREHRNRLAAALEQLDRLSAELQRIRRRHEH